MKPFQITAVPYATAAAFVAQHHRYLPVPPPRMQIRACYGVWWKGRLRAVAMVGNPVSPHLSRSHVEVRRLASDGLYGACSALYRTSLGYATAAARKLVTYTRASETGASLRAAGAVPVSVTHGGVDCRRGRVNRLAGVPKVRWEWPETAYRVIEEEV